MGCGAHAKHLQDASWYLLCSSPLPSVGTKPKWFPGGVSLQALSGPVLRDTARLSQRYPPIDSRRLELSIPKSTLHGRWGQGPGRVDPMFPAGLDFPVPEILWFVAFRDLGISFSSNFPGTFPEFSSGTPEQTPETATAFSSFLRYPTNRLLPAMGFLVSQHGQLGVTPPPPFLSVSPLGEHAKWRCDTLPPTKGVSQR